MKLRLLAVAEAELDEARDWYEVQLAGLGKRFLEEVREGRRRIAEYPHAWHPLGDGLRRYRLSSFPYGLIYVVELNEIVVLAVAHLHREPNYWRERIGK